MCTCRTQYKHPENARQKLVTSTNIIQCNHFTLHLRGHRRGQTSEWVGALCCFMFSSVQFSYSIYVSHSLIIKIMTAALSRSIAVKKHFSFQTASVSDAVLISGGRLFHADGSATEKLRGPKPVWNLFSFVHFIVTIHCTVSTLL